MFKKIQLEFKYENEAKKQDADSWYDTRLLIIFEENYVQKDLEKREIQVKKWWQKQATMGMRAQYESNFCYIGKWHEQTKFSLPSSFIFFKLCPIFVGFFASQL